MNQDHIYIPQERSDFSPNLAKDFNFRSFGKRLLKNWYWFVVALLIGVTLAVIFVRYEIPIYSSSSKMLISLGKSSSAISTEALGESLGFESSFEIDNELQMLKSSILMKRVVDSLELNYIYSHQGKVRNTHLYNPKAFSITLADSIFYDKNEPIQYGSIHLLIRPDGNVYRVSNEVDTSLLNLKSLIEIGNRFFVFRKGEEWFTPKEDQAYVFNWQNPQSTARGYAGRLQVSQIKKSNVILMRFQDANRTLAADVLNTVMYYYDRIIVEENASTGAQTLDFISERLDSVQNELFTVENNLARYKRTNSLAVGVTGAAEDYLARLNNFDRDLAELTVKGEIIDDVLSVVSDPANEFKAIPISSEIIDGALAGLITNYNDLVFQREQTLETATAQNPSVITFAERIDNLRSTLKRSLRSLREENRERANRIRSAIKPIEANLTAIPKSERVLIQLERRRTIKEALFLFLSQRKEETAITVAAKKGNVRVIEQAIPSSIATWPKPKATYAFGGIIALVIPFVLVGISELLDTKIKTEDDIARVTNTPVLGKIIRGPVTKGLSVKAGSRSATTEMFRLLRTNLSFRLGKLDSAVLMVTSGSSGEGKSYVTANLGAATALAKQKVLLVEADLRRPSLIKEITGSTEKVSSRGFSELLQGTASLSEVVTQSSIPGLSFVSAGGGDADVGNLMMSTDLLGDIVEEMKQAYDMIIFDMAPVTLVSDALLMRNYADATLYLVRAGFTPKPSLEKLKTYRSDAMLKNIGIVLNAVTIKKGSYYSGYNYYGSK